MGIEGPEIFTLNGWSEPLSDDDDDRTTWKCWCAAHKPLMEVRKVLRPKVRPTTEDAGLPSETSSNVDSGIISVSEVEEVSEYQRLIVLELELEHDEENRMYSRNQFGDTPAPSAGSRTSLSGSMSGEPSTQLSSGTGHSGPSSGSTSYQTTAPTSESATSDNLPPGAPLTSESLRTLDTLPEQRTLNLPSADQVFSPPDTLEGGDRFTSNTSPIPEEPVYGLEGDDSWYPSIHDIQASTTSKSKPIRALEKMRLLASGRAYRQSPAIQRLSNGGLSRNSNSTRTGSSMESHIQSPAPAGSNTSRSARSRPAAPPAAGGGHGSVGTMDIFAVLSDITEQMSRCQDLKSFLQVVVGIIKDLTQFHRVLIYQFDEHWNGQVRG